MKIKSLNHTITVKKSKYLIEFNYFDLAILEKINENYQWVDNVKDFVRFMLSRGIIIIILTFSCLDLYSIKILFKIQLHILQIV